MKPRVFVSSTCFDLKEIRSEVHAFLDQVGYQGLLSEQPSFPVDTAETTVENCRQQVEREADIFVLIVGLKYGTLDPISNRSITNLEYLAARGKGVPIYSFMHSRLIDLVEGRETAIVDEIDPALIAFARQVRNIDSKWTFRFEKSTDVTETLKQQFAHLMFQGLDWWRRVRTDPAGTDYSRLSGRSLRLALERPRCWEHFLFAQVLEDEVAICRHLRDEHNDAFALELGEDVEDAGVWAKHRMDELTRITVTVGPLLDGSVARAVGAPGEPGNVADLIFVGRALGRVYSSVLQWSRRVRIANGPKKFRPVQDALALFTDEIAKDIEAYGPRIRREIEDALSKAQPGVKQEVDLTLTLRVSPEANAAPAKALKQVSTID